MHDNIEHQCKLSYFLATGAGTMTDDTEPFG